jgi:uncharacterized protein
MPLAERIAAELQIKASQASAAIALLDEGATVPFISRYRKEVTQGLDDTQLRNLEERLRYLRELDLRRTTILQSIKEQGKLGDQLKQDILAADTKTRLEDLYLPYKTKRRTRAQQAREAGLEPLADALLQDPTKDPEQEATAFISADRGVESTKAALEGARYILMERFAEDANLLGKLRTMLKQDGMLRSRLLEGKEREAAKFRDYFEHDEPVHSVPSHRALAMLRGRNEGFLALSLVLPGADELPVHPGESCIANRWQVSQRGRAADKWLAEVVRWTWRVKMLPHLETDLLTEMREAAELEAIKVFADNLKDLLMAAPAGARPTIGLDPGLRTGVKVAVVDRTGKVVDHCAIYPTQPQNKIAEAEATLVNLCRKHRIELIAIGNGTAGRETDRFVGDMIKHHPELKLTRIMVNESGASIYSASEYAAREFPDLDVTIRGAVSIARRLQDPLAELVKIDPKSIGVGQYQHDVSQVAMARQLDTVVEDCVNGVGVDVNTASVPLLNRVSGLSRLLAENIVAHRDQNGPFTDRQQLKKVARFGEKSFEQAAGFLRVNGGANPLDASAVHPETYGVVERIAREGQRELASLMGDSAFIKTLSPADYIDEHFGLPTVTDILAELDKPGRDPRPEFRAAQFRDGVEKLADLQPDMVLEGTVTNVTNFGAFVDVGVHQDGLVHISQVADRFIKDPREVVKAGDIVKVKVLEVDHERKRISMTMRMDTSAADKRESRDKPSPQQPLTRKQRQHQQGAQSAPQSQMGTLGQLLADAQKKGSR